MSRKTTARRAATAAVAAAVLVPGFALGIAQAGANSPAITGLSVTAVKATTAPTFAITGKNLDNVGKVAIVPDGVARTGGSVIELAEARLPRRLRLQDRRRDAERPGRRQVPRLRRRGRRRERRHREGRLPRRRRPGRRRRAVCPATTGPASAGVKITVTGSGFLGTSRVVFTQAGVEYPVKAFKVLERHQARGHHRRAARRRQRPRDHQRRGHQPAGERDLHRQHGRGQGRRRSCSTSWAATSSPSSAAASPPPSRATGPAGPQGGRRLH